ncbi:hypothetical protein CSV67_00160 [Sporosarcina sp. P2]|uniref:hypothetical protein n=1 Tax=Sporosarcina sp. P2 TaxID=2048251 RepID=UPI000C16B73F|nr:hypothetical protein [Sporosarcina sp. P2]PID03933.1 hypothetical protein CSV67_00160 [Sporosarcina sp. P2]
MSNKKLENSMLWILCIVLLSSIFTIVFLLDLSIFPVITFDFSASAALITSVITLFTLLEIRKQRIKTYEPSIVIKRETHKYSFENSFYNRVEISLLNIGYGSAKNMHIKWKYEEVVNDITDSAHDFNKTVMVVGEAVVHIENDRKQHIDYILPISVDSEPYKIRIPLILTYHILNKYMELYEKKDLNRISDYKIPFSIVYYDINDDKHVLMYTLKISMSYIDKGSNIIGIDTSVSRE